MIKFKNFKDLMRNVIDEGNSNSLEDGIEKIGAEINKAINILHNIGALYGLLYREIDKLDKNKKESYEKIVDKLQKDASNIKNKGLESLKKDHSLFYKQVVKDE